MGPHFSNRAASLAVVVDRQVGADFRDDAADAATGLQQLAMHVDQVGRAGALMQVVDVLGDQKHLARPFPLQLRECGMGGVGLDIGLEQTGAAVVVELVDKVRIALEPFRRRDILQPDAFPHAAGAAEGVQTGFLGNSGTGQDDDPVGRA